MSKKQLRYGMHEYVIMYRVKKFVYIINESLQGRMYTP